MSYRKLSLTLAVIALAITTTPAKANDLFGALVDGALQAATSENQQNQNNNPPAQQQNAQQKEQVNPAATAAAGLISESVRTGANPADIIKYQARGSAESMKYDARHSGANLINNLLTTPPQ